jgi:anti-sigma factor RsiW
VLKAGRPAQRRSVWPLGVAAALLVSVGVAGGHWWAIGGRVGSQMASSPEFVREAAVAHAVFTPEKRHPVEVTGAEEAHLVQWLGRRLGAPVKAPVLLDRGYRLLGGRLLPGDPAPRAQFMYEDAQGRRVTLFVAVFAPGKAPAETSFRSVREGERESFYWVEGSFGYALSAQLPAAEVQVLAREVHAQLAR